MQNRSSELLTSPSVKTPSSALVFQAWGCDGKVHLILVKAVTTLASESLIVLEFSVFRWYVPTYQCARITSAVLLPPLVSVVITRTGRPIAIIIHSVLICERPTDSMREVWFRGTKRSISFNIYSGFEDEVASYLVDTWDSLPGDKKAVVWIRHS